jgi:hypothetical protein
MVPEISEPDKRVAASTPGSNHRDRQEIAMANPQHSTHRADDFFGIAGELIAIALAAQAAQKRLTKALKQREKRP